jgi:tryptophan synthase beta subunit
MLVACVGGGSNAIGLFHPFLEDQHIAMIGVEAGGRSLEMGEHAARFSGGSLGSPTWYLYTHFTRSAWTSPRYS